MIHWKRGYNMLYAIREGETMDDYLNRADIEYEAMCDDEMLGY